MMRLARLLKSDRSGASAVEFALIAPVIILLFLGGLTLFDIVRTYQRVVVSNSVVADLISRQTAVTTADLDKYYNVYKNLLTSTKDPNALRISSIVRTKTGYSEAWSKESGTVSLLNPKKFDTTTLPDITIGDSLIYVEGSSRYTAMSSILGFGDFTYKRSAVSRPRFIAAVAYTK